MHSFAPGERPDHFADRLRAARGGSLEARGQLLMGFRVYLLRIAQRELDTALHAKAGPLDMVQETFQEAHRDFAQFQGTTADDLRLWLRRILRHNLANCIRRYCTTGKRRLASEVPISHTDLDGRLPTRLASEDLAPTRLALRAEQEVAVRRAVERLPEKDRQVIRWRFQEDRSFAEIGRLLSGTEDAARMRFHRALERLRGDLSPLC